MKNISFNLIKNKRKILSISMFLVIFSLIGILNSSFNTEYKKPIKVGMYFIGGNEIRI